MPDPAPVRLLNTQQLADKIGCSRTTIWQLRKETGFPEPVNIRSRSPRFVESEIDAWLLAQREGAGSA